MSDTQDPERMLTELVLLRSALQDVVLPLDLPGTGELRAAQQEMVAQLEDYVIPRVMTLDAPLLAVVGGSTGAGKSTLVNSVVGRRVTVPGVLRPTTRSPVLVHHPDDAEWFGQDRLLPQLRRVDHATDAPDALQLVASDTVPRGLAILDAPDVDSVEEQNRLLAAQLLAAADMWLFVTSAARYADQVPWAFLQRAAERSTDVAVILDRTPADAVETVATHLARMLAARGLKDAPLFIVHEGPVDEEGLLPAETVSDVRGWLESLADDEEARAGKVATTLQGAIRTLTRRVHPIADAAEEQTGAHAALQADVATAYAAARSAASTAAGDGSLLRGEVLVRWQELVGTGELLRSLENRVGWLRDRVVNAVRGRPQQAERITLAVGSSLELLLVQQAETAAGQAAAGWSDSAAGNALLASSETPLGRASRDLRRSTERSMRDWQADVVEMVRTEGADKRTSARFLALGVTSLGVALTVVVLGRTLQTAAASGDQADRRSGSQPGGQPGGAAEAVDLGRTLLVAVFGEQAVDGLVERARVSLERRLASLLAQEQVPWTVVLDRQQLRPDAPGALRRAARRVDDLRFAQQLAQPSATEDV